MRTSNIIVRTIVAIFLASALSACVTASPPRSKRTSVETQTSSLVVDAGRGSGLIRFRRRLPPPGSPLPR